MKFEFFNKNWNNRIANLHPVLVDLNDVLDTIKNLGINEGIRCCSHECLYNHDIIRCLLKNVPRVVEGKCDNYNPKPPEEKSRPKEILEDLENPYFK